MQKIIDSRANAILRLGRCGFLAKKRAWSFALKLVKTGKEKAKPESGGYIFLSSRYFKVVI